MATKSEFFLVDQTLTFSGELVVGTVAQLWSRLDCALANVQAANLEAVTRIDSAGLAMLVAMTSICRAKYGRSLAFSGQPRGWDALCAAYRLPSTLQLPD